MKYTIPLGAIAAILATMPNQAEAGFAIAYIGAYLVAIIDFIIWIAVPISALATFFAAILHWYRKSQKQSAK